MVDVLQTSSHDLSRSLPASSPTISTPNVAAVVEAKVLTFKQVDGLDIEMDVYIPTHATKENPVSVLLWWHGGGLLQGTRKAICPHMLNAPQKHFICVVSADYRLAPQTRLPEILSDCKAAMDFIRSSEFTSATEGRVDSSKMVISGSSAGGWLSLLCGTGIGFSESGLDLPKPVQGIAAIYPITDLLDPFWTTKQHPVSYMDRVIDRSEVEPFINPNDQKTSWASADGKRSIFYHYMVQEGILASLLLDGTDIPPVTYSIAQSLKSGKFKPPPTYIIHGDSDGKVPHQQALDVVAALRAINSPVVYIELEGLDHGFDKDPTVEMASMYEFILDFLED